MQPREQNFFDRSDDDFTFRSDPSSRVHQAYETRQQVNEAARLERRISMPTFVTECHVY